MIDPVVSEIPAGAVVADVRSYLDGRVGRDAYDAGHVPGAVFVDLDEALAAHTDPAAGGRHPLPTPEHFAAAMADAGIGDDDVVVAYDDAGGVMAARLVWMLRATGHQAALLDGGIQAWDGPLETAGAARGRRRASACGRGRPSSSPRSTRPPTRPPTSSSTPASASASTAPRTTSTRASATSPAPAACRAARTSPPTAASSSRGELRARFAEVGITGAEPVVSYCGSGVTACHNLLALEHAGLGSGRLFPGSWSQWSRDPDRPLETS